MKSIGLSLKGNYRFALVLAIVAALLTAAAVLFIPAGSIDPTFGRNGVAITDLGSDSDSGSVIALQSDGKIVLAGSAQLDLDNAYHRTPFLLRYNSNGALDTSFGTSGRVAAEDSAFSGARALIQPDGKLVMGGSLYGDLAVARYNTNGSLDASFGTHGVASVHFSSDEADRFADVAIQPNGGIIVGGSEDIGNYTYFILVRFKSDGTPDTDFNRNASNVWWAFHEARFNSARAVVVQGDGKIIMSGVMQDNIGPEQWTTLARFNSDGSLDPTFGVGGGAQTAIANFQVNQSALAVQADGKILAVGTSFPESGTDNVPDDLGVARFNANGSLDTTFGGTGVVISDFGNDEYGNDVSTQADGKIVVAGRSTGAAGLLLVRYNYDGSLDSSFGANGRVVTGAGTDIQSGGGAAIQPDGKILVAGAGNGNVALARFTSTSRNATLVTLTLRSQATNDGWLLESSENSNVGGWFDKLGRSFQVGDNPKDRQSRGLLSFNTASLPDTAVITSAQVNIKKQAVVGTNPFTTHGPLLLEIRSGSFSNNLALQLSDFSAPASPGSVREQFSPSGLHWYRSTLSSGNLALINRTGMTQFRLRFTKDDNDDMSADYLLFCSGNSDIANQPQLVITYYVP